MTNKNISHGHRQLKKKGECHTETSQVYKLVLEQTDRLNQKRIKVDALVGSAQTHL
jgi:hypothetical protein